MDERNKNEEIRREKLKRLIEDQGGHAKFVEKHNLTQSQASYLSQIANGYSFGEKSAEKWRIRLKLPIGFFDVAALTSKEPEQEGPLTDEQKRMIHLMGRMNQGSRDALLKIASLLPADEKMVGGRRIGGERRQRENTIKQERRHNLLTKTTGGE
ncbi:hypothetical protein SAMN05216404_106186 [Nitrosospira multiformis]|uniref:Uncharacterized protein n=1 Tax=Nitrosospira multiformis TaxID=1231 RepID=A0A1H8ITF8_9PROT|nr:hypothetical protein [Nitrosospira multiformis]SEN72110.1 hypothetical protein SAMN05216404_106186 [Nitrosospira multiformis]